jgi:hemoglobin
MRPRNRAVLLSAWKKQAHRELKISPAIFDEVAAELARSLDHFKVPEPEKGEVLAAFAAHKGEVTEGYSE